MVGGRRYGVGVTSTNDIRRWATAFPEAEETEHFRFHVPVFKVRGRTFVGMGRYSATAVVCIVEQEAYDLAAAHDRRDRDAPVAAPKR